MTLAQILFTAVLLTFVFNTPSAAELPRNASFPAIAAHHCNAEWARIEELTPDAWAAYDLLEIVPEIDPVTTEAYNKFATATIAFGDYTTSFVGFYDEENHTPSYIALARAQYDLAICLTLTETERNLIVDLARTEFDEADTDIHAVLFEPFDLFECLQMAQASEAIFALELSHQSLPFDFTAITSANMKICN
ncbi:hypothetical protein [Cochlodiniinecator piscidefendens]|uniref:hypothetical protein n=1 Tax=Cochlodiniinecator piscidefendens TaxID=2715756 RepID=UPI00140837C2|nr:hypothetical protein [Cochlodiniinecator piscidefendens]